MFEFNVIYVVLQSLALLTRTADKHPYVCFLLIAIQLQQSASHCTKNVPRHANKQVLNSGHILVRNNIFSCIYKSVE